LPTAKRSRRNVGICLRDRTTSEHNQTTAYATATHIHSTLESSLLAAVIIPDLFLVLESVLSTKDLITEDLSLKAKAK